MGKHNHSLFLNTGEIMRLRRIWALVVVLLVCVSYTGPASAADQAAASFSSEDSAPIQPSSSSTLTVQTTSLGAPCMLTADYVHMSSSTLNNVKADAHIDCTNDIFVITSMRVRMHKKGLIPHYYDGPLVTSGTARAGAPYWYKSFALPCSTTAQSIYWSTAYVYGYYLSNPGVTASAQVRSPEQLIWCGTSW